MTTDRDPLKLTPAQLEAGRIALARYEARVRIEAVADALGLDMNFEPQAEPDGIDIGAPDPHHPERR